MAVVFSIKQKVSGDKPPVRVSVANPESTTVGDLKKMYMTQTNRKLDVNRVRLSVESTNETLTPNEKVLSSIPSLKAGDVTLVYKDLGPQISWRTVFIVEYFFPMIVFPLLWVWTRKMSSTPAATEPTSCWQDMLAALFTLHFAKRELETLFVHRFGNDTMPILNIFKNSGYYWLFAFWIAYMTMHPQYTMPASVNRRYFGVGLFVVCELLNLKAHLDLRNLRPAGTRIRRVPQGVLFQHVSCPNYLFEILSWVGFTLASQTVASAAFTLVGAAQMTLWAIQKHKRYRKEFDGKEGRELYPKNRKILIPFVF